MSKPCTWLVVPTGSHADLLGLEDELADFVFLGFFGGFDVFPAEEGTADRTGDVGDHVLACDEASSNGFGEVCVW